MKLVEVTSTSQFLKSPTDIRKWLQDMSVVNFTIGSNSKVTVQGDVDISAAGLSRLPVQFEEVTGNFICSRNSLVSLAGCPRRVVRHFDCSMNNLDTLDYCPEEVGANFICKDNDITSLIGISDKIKTLGFILLAPVRFYITFEKIKTGGLGLLLIDKLNIIEDENSKIDYGPAGIINKYLGHPDRIFECQEELIEAGFEEYAQL